eukprot:m.139749 g.139749  ORF g.139749 m.139749 type:complete len:164 (+) comp15956_c0_seq1:115-606(+)
MGNGKQSSTQVAVLLVMTALASAGLSAYAVRHGALQYLNNTVGHHLLLAAALTLHSSSGKSATGKPLCYHRELRTTRCPDAISLTCEKSCSQSDSWPDRRRLALPPLQGLPVRLSLYNLGRMKQTLFRVGHSYRFIPSTPPSQQGHSKSAVQNMSFCLAQQRS